MAPLLLATEPTAAVAARLDEADVDDDDDALDPAPLAEAATAEATATELLDVLLVFSDAVPALIMVTLVAPRKKWAGNEGRCWRAARALTAQKTTLLR